MIHSCCSIIAFCHASCLSSCFALDIATSFAFTSLSCLISASFGTSLPLHFCHAGLIDRTATMLATRKSIPYLNILIGKPGALLCIIPSMYLISILATRTRSRARWNNHGAPRKLKIKCIGKLFVKLYTRTFYFSQL